MPMSLHSTAVLEAIVLTTIKATWSKAPMRSIRVAFCFLPAFHPLLVSGDATYSNEDGGKGPVLHHTNKSGKGCSVKSAMPGSLYQGRISAALWLLWLANQQMAAAT